MTTVREDKHSLYIMCGGYIFRPVYPVEYKHLNIGGNSIFAKGEKIKARHIGGSPLSVLRKNGASKGESEEVWISHGCYMGNPEYSGSESLYMPSYFIWK